MGGPAPIPTKLKILHGNPGKRALNKNEPDPEVKIPDPPGFLCDEALDEWNRVAPELERLELLSEIDMAMLASYCQAYKRWYDAEVKLKETGDSYINDNGVVVVNPLVYVAIKASVQMHKFASEFGMSPSSRSKVTVKASRNKNEYEKWKGRQKGQK